MDCIPDINSLSESSTKADYKKWEDCLIQKTIQSKTKEELLEDIDGTLIQQGLLVGFGAEVSQSYLSFMALTHVLTDEEIINNLTSTDSGIKYNAFYTTVKRNKNNVFESLKYVISDTTKINTQYGCIIEEFSLSELCIKLVTDQHTNEFVYKLNRQEMNKLDSIIQSRNLNTKY